MHDQDRISPCNIKPTNDENKEKYQLGDYWLTQYQILQTNAGISGHPEGSTPGHPGAFVTAAVTNTC